MSKLHISNTFFEWELETEPECSLVEAFKQHAIFRQLQFLPVLYAEKRDGMYISSPVEKEYWDKFHHSPQPISVPDASFTEIESFAPSRLVARFAKAHKLIYTIPSWNVVREVNSKQFSFENSPQLPGALLLHEEEQAKEWLQATKGKRVLKTCYGVSGKGHLLIDADTSWEHIVVFLKKQWRKNLPVIAEPWMIRLLDFSTQWFLREECHYLGATICKNDARGQYRSTIVGEERALFGKWFPFLQEHCKIAKTLLRKMQAMGFFGNVGIDAMIYLLPDSSTPLLHPIVEINARKTMGWVALQFQKKYGKGYPLCLSYANAREGLLPQSILPQRNLFAIKCRAVYK